jgi:hypothetical protein
VLADGGRLLHFLDQNPHLASVFERLVPHGLVVLPNVFGDPSAAHFPEDLCVVPAAGFAELVQLLRRHGEPVAEPLSRYLGLFTEKPWQLARALAEFDHLASDNERRMQLRQAFEAAPPIATHEERTRLGDLRAQLVSSSQDLTGRLGRELASPTLQVLYNNLTFAGEVVAAAPGAPAYRSLSVGQHRSLAFTPERTLVSNTPHARAGQQLRELGLHVFAANRTVRPAAP